MQAHYIFLRAIQTMLEKQMSKFEEQQNRQEAKLDSLVLKVDQLSAAFQTLSGKNSIF